MQRIFSLTVFTATFALVACTTSAPPPKTVSDAQPYVSRINLTNTVGETGRPFRSEVQVSATHLHDAEFSISNLPAGLRFDKEKQMIIGIPKDKGFHTVTVAVREHRGKGVHWNTVETRWFTEEFELRFFNAMDESADDGGFGTVAETDVDPEKDSEDTGEDDLGFDF